MQIMNAKTSLLLVSNPGMDLKFLSPALKKTTIAFDYSEEERTITSIQQTIKLKFQHVQFASIAFLLESSSTDIFLCPEKKIPVNEENWKTTDEVFTFFAFLKDKILDIKSGYMDFLNVSMETTKATQLIAAMEADLKVKIRFTFSANGFGASSTVWGIYFNVIALQDLINSENLIGYEKLRTVGKGAFGTAILYRRSNGTLAVIKEINMVELTASERQMALNEVQVLSLMNHINIIRYFRSFEREGVLMIEMEYANGGTLSQFLSKKQTFLLEKDIVFMFKQIVAAIEYMHTRNVLHRDLKTANIFLTKDKIIKVGDFGISKMMNTKAQAQTVLGTPYYISPEMCEGKNYDQKSDVWAMGCILYEMTCLQKAFQGSNLPALVNTIMKGEYNPIPKEYSSELENLIRDILQIDPSLRPTGSNISRRLDVMVTNLAAKSPQMPAHRNYESQKERSVLYELSGRGSSFSLNAIPLLSKLIIKEVAVSSTHYIVLTTEHAVFAWGEGLHGQLGHGDTIPWRDIPTQIKNIQDKQIKSVSAGEGFSIFISDSGMIMSCGDGSFGCLGHSDWTSISKPRLIEKLLHMDILSVSCGSRHVAALSADNMLYTWGQGKGGRLGLGDEEEKCSPSQVILPKDTIVRLVRCGLDATIIGTSAGKLMASGINSFNKLGLHKVNWFGNTQLIGKSVTFCPINNSPIGCIDVSIGFDHTVILTNEGQVYTLGKNDEGQIGHNKSTVGLVNGISHRTIKKIQAGIKYTVLTTSDQAILILGRWGNSSDPANINFKREVLTEPTEIFALYSSQQQISQGHLISLHSLHALPQSIFLCINTTVPLARKMPTNTSTNNDSKIDSSDDDSLGQIPQWIKTEAAQSEAVWQGFN